MSGQFKPLSRELPKPRARRADPLPGPGAGLGLQCGDEQPPAEQPPAEQPRIDGLAPARGLILGLVVGAALWIGIFALAWRFFR